MITNLKSFYDRNFREIKREREKKREGRERESKRKREGERGDHK